MTFDKLDFEYKKIEAQLAEGYHQFFESLKKKMVEDKGKMMNNLSEKIDEENLLASFELHLRKNIVPMENTLGAEIDALINEKVREKWSLQYQELWRMCKKHQEHNWKQNLRTSFATLFSYEHHIENYKKQMRKEIVRHFKSKKGKACQWNVSEMDGLFEEMFEKMLKEARQQFPVNDVTALIEEVYRNSNVIKKRQIEITVHPELQKIQMQPQNGKEVEMTQLNVFSFVKRIFVKTF